MKKLEIITSNITSKEASLIQKKYPHKDLSLLNNCHIHKLYYQNSFLGFVAVSIINNKTIIEDIAYLKNKELLQPLISHLLKKVILENAVYYNEEKDFEPIYQDLFNTFKFEKTNKELCLE